MKEFLRFSLLAILLAPFAWADQNSTLINKVTAGDASGGEHFGSAVSQWGNYLAVGAKDADETTLYWVEDNGSLIELAILTPPDGGANSQFGVSVSMTDGIIAVGAKWSDHDGHSNSGAAYLYQVVPDGTVHYLHKVTAHDANATDYFGTSVSFSHGILAVGAPSDNHSGHTDAGSAYLYRLEHNGSLSPLGKVTASDANASDEFGYSVSQSGDLLVVGAWGDDHEGGSNAGSAYLFQLEQNGSVTELGKVTASDASANDQFGRSVSLFGDTFAVGAYLHDPDGLNTAGAAYLFHLEQNGSISYLDKIKDAPAGSTFGNSLSMRDDLLIVGAYQETHDGKADAGAVYLYRVEHNGSATLLDRIVSHDANVSDEFGFAVSLSDGLLAVGAQNADHGGDTDPGAVYVFDIDRAANRPPVDIRPDPFLGFSPEKEELIHNLQTGWLKATEGLVFNAYGWTVDASDDWNVTVHEDGDEPNPLYFVFDVDQNGQLVVNSLEFHMPALQPYLEASMGKFLLAREMCRMLMTKNSYYGDITGDGVSSGDWFKLGLMDFLVGADDRILAILGAEPTDSEIDALLAEVGDGETTVTDQQIAAACLAVRYLDFKLKGAGKTGGVKHMTQWMKTQYENGAGAANSGINHYIYYESGGFSLTEFKGTAGRDFVKNHVLPKLDNNDTGSVLGGDVTGGPALFWHAVVPDVRGAPQSNVLYEVDEWANVLEFEEGSPVGTVVGTFRAIDPDEPQIGWKGYDLIDHGSNLSWTDAKAAAAAADAADPFHWVYLATVTSEAEHNLTAHLVAQTGVVAWLGGSDSAVEGEWRWTEGPEGQEAGGQGLQFWQGGPGGNPVNGLFSNWHSVEPSNSNDEDFVKLNILGDWIDNANHPTSSAYLLEYDQELTHVYSLVSGEGDENNDMFVLEADGTLRTEYVLDYESDATFYQIRVRATDELNASFEKSFWVDLLDVNEDPDGDGLHNDVDLDDDGDGYPDTEEDSANSDPRNAWSLPAVTKIIYVDEDADGENNGSSWASAYDNLQAALAEADGVNRTQIWIAEGVYRPDVGPGQTEGERNSTFQLKNRLEIIGGFQGDEQTFEEREMHGFTTYLSGDVGAHNWPDDNVYHVVTASGVDRTAILLDLGIGRGRADGPTEWDKRGAGMLANNGSPSLRHLLFFDNHAVGLNSGGGGLCVYNGGAPVAFSCVFEGNSAEWGGAVKLSAGSSAIFYNALMLRNSASSKGGALGIFESNATIAHSTITDNNVTIDGGGIYIGSDCNVSVANSVLWGNHGGSGANLYKVSSTTFVSDHSIIQGSSLADLPDGDPLFVDPAFNDFRLRLGSPAIDAGNPAQVGALPVDYGGVNRTHDAGPDLGAYEGGVDAVNLGGLVSYSGLIETGPYRVWLMDESGNRIKEVEMEEPDSFSFVVERGHSYKIKAFRDAENDGWPGQGDPWDYHDHNPIQINESRNDFDVSLEDRDSDSDGFLDLHEVDANTDPNDAGSRPGLEYGLVAYFPFDGNASDMSDNAISSTMDGYGPSDTKWVNGPFGQGLFFDGVNDTVLLGNGGILDDMQPLSVSAWVKRIGLGYLLSKRTESTGYWRLGLDANNFGWFRDFSGSGHVSAQAPTFAAEQWRLITLTWNGDTNGSGARIYVDDQEVTTQRGDADGNFLSDSANLLHIGSRGGSSEFFHGVIDELRIWDREILPQEVQEIFNPEVDDGLVAHWTFDETEGAVLHDSSGNDVHGTMNGFTDPWSAGRVGGALYFDGVDDYVSFPGATQLDDLEPFSFAGWIKLDQGGDGYVVAKRSESTGYWRLFSSSTTHSWLVRKTTGTPPALTADATTPFLEWRHLAMTWDGSLAGDGMKFYLNGEEVVGAQKTPGTGELVSDANNLFTIGNRPQNNSSYFKGWLDDFHIWNRVISPEEVDAVANPIPPDENATVSGEVFYEGPVPGPVIVWVFDEEGQVIREQVLAEGPGDFSFTLPKGQAYDLKAFRDGNGNGQLDAHWEVGEPFAHHGDWNSSTDSYDMVFVDENLTGVDIAITWHGDHDEDGITDWEEYVAGLEEEGGPSGLWAGMLAEYFLDGNASDDSGNNLHGVVHGALPGTNRFGEEGMALFFDGVDDYVQLQPLELGSEYTLSVWILPDEEKGGGYFNILSNNGAPVWGVREGNLKQYLFGRVEGSPVERHEWTHLVLVRDDETHTLYKNGELDATANALAGDDAFSVIGAYLPEAGELTDREPFHGMIDDLLVWGRALPTEEVVGLHEIETLSLNRGLIGFYLLDGNESNEFDNANQVVVHGAEPGKNRFGEEGMALEFDGEDDYVQLQPLELGSEYTLSVWILPDEEKGGGYFNILSNNGDPVWGVRESNLKQYLFGRVEGSPVERHEWTHLVLVRDDETHTLYKNGELDATANALAGDDVFSIIGAYLPAAEELADREPFHGMIDDLIVWDRALSQDEVELLHDFETQSPEGHEGGEEHEEGEPNGHEEAFVPIVRTYHHEEQSNGVCWFGGQVLADGGSPVLETGVLVSRSIFFEDAIRLPGEMDPENNQFLVITDDLEKGARYYYRAYARNAVGENVGSIKKFVTQEEAHPGAWWRDMPEVGGGWRVSDWFGEFRNFEQTDWIYHARLGWVFVVPDEERGLWLWHRELGWLWTQEGVWPHLWRNEVSGWIYFLKSHEGRPIIFDYGTSDYLVLP